MDLGHRRGVTDRVIACYEAQSRPFTGRAPSPSYQGPQGLGRGALWHQAGRRAPVSQDRPSSQAPA